MRFWKQHPAAVCALGLAVVTLPLMGCSKKEGIIEPPPPVQGDVRVEDGVVKWSTDVPARGSVRYGFRRGRYDHMAYPSARSRRDRALIAAHEVPLLDLSAGETIYFQVVAEPSQGGRVISPADSFVADRNSPANLLTSTMVHIGFGDCHLITMPNGKRVLIDGGWNDAEPAVESFMTGKGVMSVEAMLATHIHADHLGGLVGNAQTRTDGVVNSQMPKVFFDSPQKITTARSAYTDLLLTVEDLGIPLEILRRGQSSADVAALNWDPQVFVRVLSSGTAPNYQPSGYEGTDINNDSIVLKFTYGDVDFIIGGDAESAAEASILSAFPAENLNVEYYKAHHHGLPDASSASWVNTLKPRVAFIPNTDQAWDGDLEGALVQTRSRLANVGADVYVIDDAESLDRRRGDGAQYNITFATDGTSYEVRLELATQVVPSKAWTVPECVAHFRSRHQHQTLPAESP